MDDDTTQHDDTHKDARSHREEVAVALGRRYPMCHLRPDIDDLTAVYGPRFANARLYEATTTDYDDTRYFTWGCEFYAAEGVEPLRTVRAAMARWARSGGRDVLVDREEVNFAEALDVIPLGYLVLEGIAPVLRDPYPASVEGLSPDDLVLDVFDDEDVAEILGGEPVAFEDTP